MAADDYFAAINRVEQHMEIGPVPKPAEEAKQEGKVVNKQEKIQIITWLEWLALSELCQEERLEIVN